MHYKERMNAAIALKAHYDGEKICLDEPFRLRPETKLVVMVLPSEKEIAELNDLYELGRQSLARAYGEDEPDYSDLLGRPFPKE